jgi:crossover junction endodeoxyribonuclease RuvC
MFEGRVLGVDPGIATTGLAVLAREAGVTRLVWSATVRTEPRRPEAQRLRTLHDAVERAILAHRPSAVAVERVMWGANKTSALSVARATGVVLLAAASAGLPVEEYAPLEVKMAVTGAGGADKRQVRSALARLHRLREVPAQPDAADAVAVALCHLQQTRLRTVAAGAR